METSTTKPFVQTPTATQDNGTIPTQVEAFAATQAEADTAAELPPIPL